jgi:hypothetical protein
MNKIKDEEFLFKKQLYFPMNKPVPYLMGLAETAKK